MAFCLLGFMLAHQNAGGAEPKPQLVELNSVEVVSVHFPKEAKENVCAYWPLVQKELKNVGLGDNIELIAYALATIRVETSRFSPSPEKPSSHSKTLDCAGYAGIKEACTVRPFGQYDFHIKFDRNGNPIINKHLGNCLYKGKDLDLMRARQGMPPLPECEDGDRFRGRGFIQLTGRYNYELMQREIADTVKVDIVNNPDDAGKPEVATKILVAYLAKHRSKIEKYMKEKNYFEARHVVTNLPALKFDDFSKVITDCLAPPSAPTGLGLIQD